MKASLIFVFVAASGCVDRHDVPHAHQMPSSRNVVLVGLHGYSTFHPSDRAIAIGETLQWNFVSDGQNVVIDLPGSGGGNRQSVVDLKSTNPEGDVFRVSFDEAFVAENPAPNNIYRYQSRDDEGNVRAQGTVRLLTESDMNPPPWRDVDASVFAVWEFGVSPTSRTAPDLFSVVVSNEERPSWEGGVRTSSGAEWADSSNERSGVYFLDKAESISFTLPYAIDSELHTGRVQLVHRGAQPNYSINLSSESSGLPRDPIRASVVTENLSEGWYHSTLEFHIEHAVGEGWEFSTEGQAIDGVIIDLAAGQQEDRRATSPSIATDATGIGSSPTLTWTPGVGATSHEILFGTDPLLAATTFRAVQPNASFSPGQLDDGTTYYWRVDEHAGSGIAKGDVWSFTTTTASLGHWSRPVWIKVMVGHLVLLPTGKVMTWQYPGDGGSLARTYYFDPDDPENGLHDEAPYDIFCSGMSVLADGRLVATGSNNSKPLTALFDPSSENWVMGPSMQGTSRFYPSTIISGDGTLLSFAGIDLVSREHDLSVELAPRDASRWRLAEGEDVPEEGEEAYARVHLLPDGRIFMSGQSPRSYIYDVTRKTWTKISDTHWGKWRAESPSVRLFDGRILLSGGIDTTMRGGGTAQVTELVEIIDLDSPDPAWEVVAPLSRPRAYHDAILLPDGTVFNVGGTGVYDGEDGLNNPELYDPTANTWTVLAAHAQSRSYHSSATLLPDGRVLVGGQDENETIEIYSPPYLFRGPKPEVRSVSSEAEYGKTLRIDYASRDSIGTVVLLRPGETTHSFTYNQIGVPVSFEDFGDYLLVDIPSNPNLLPPGYYLLFVLTQDGVPSVAPFIRIDDGS